MVDFCFAGWVASSPRPSPRIEEKECPRRALLQEVGDGQGGDGFGIVAVGQDTAQGSSPAQAADVLGGKQEGLGEQNLPEVLGQDWVRMRLAASHGLAIA